MYGTSYISFIVLNFTKFKWLVFVKKKKINIKLGSNARIMKPIGFDMHSENHI